MRRAALASILVLAAGLFGAACAEESIGDAGPSADATATGPVAAPADLSGVTVEVHQAPG